MDTNVLVRDGQNNMGGNKYSESDDSLVLSFRFSQTTRLAKRSAQ